MVRKAKIAVVEHARGGEGSVEFHHIVSAEELNGHGSLYAMAILRPHSSVGWHQHVGNTEPYFVLKGNDFFFGNITSERTIWHELLLRNKKRINR